MKSWSGIDQILVNSTNVGPMTPYTPHFGDQQKLLWPMGVAGINDCRIKELNFIEFNIHSKADILLELCFQGISPFLGV